MRQHYTIAFLSATMLAGTSFAAEPVPVVTGGVGEDGRAAIEQAQDNYNLKLVFTGERGMYLSDVNVVIRDNEGYELVNGVTQGPFLLAELQPGTYTLESNADGFQKKMPIKVSNSLKTYNINFPVKDNEVHLTNNNIPVPGPVTNAPSASSMDPRYNHGYNLGSAESASRPTIQPSAE